MIAARLAGARDRLRGLRYGFLTVPMACLAGGVALALGMLELERHTPAASAGLGIADDPRAARAVLTVIAGSLITVAGLTFSITMVTLQLVSQQFTPRALRRFLGDRLNQFVAGAFVAVFVFCVLVLRAVQNETDRQPAFVPAVSVTIAIVLAVGCLLLLLVFIDHIGRNIQASTIASRIAESTLAAVDHLHPAGGRPCALDADDLLAAWHTEAEPAIVCARRSGYVQSVALEDLRNRIPLRGVRIAIRVAPGDFVTRGALVAAYWPDGRDGDLGGIVERAIVIGSERDPEQDAGYGVRQLADIAVRAVSPSVNDPTTAWTCIRHLQGIMERLAVRGFPARARYYDDVALTVISDQEPFDGYVDAAYVQIGRYASDARIAGALLESLATVCAHAARCGAYDRVDALAAAVPGICHSVLSAEPGAADRHAIDEAAQRVERAAQAPIGSASRPRDGDVAALAAANGPELQRTPSARDT